MSDALIRGWHDSDLESSDCCRRFSVLERTVYEVLSAQDERIKHALKKSYDCVWFDSVVIDPNHKPTQEASYRIINQLAVTDMSPAMRHQIERLVRHHMFYNHYMIPPLVHVGYAFDRLSGAPAHAIWIGFTEAGKHEALAKSAEAEYVARSKIFSNSLDYTLGKLVVRAARRLFPTPHAPA